MRQIITGILILVVIAGLAWWFVSSPNDIAEELEPETFTAEEVATHNSATDCWTIISGQVYDVTDYIPQHPGGDEILRACGQDATGFFTTRTDDQGQPIGSGEGHSANARSILSEYRIGELE